MKRQGCENYRNGFGRLVHCIGYHLVRGAVIAGLVFGVHYGRNQMKDSPENPPQIRRIAEQSLKDISNILSQGLVSSR